MLEQQQHVGQLALLARLEQPSLRNRRLLVGEEAALDYEDFLGHT